MRGMRAVGMAVVGILLVSSLGGAGQPPGRWIVHLQGPPEQAQAAIITAVERSGGRVLHAYSLIPAVAVELPLPALNGILKNPNVRDAVVGVEPDAIATASPKPDNPGGGGGKPKPQPPPETPEWGVNRIDADRAWLGGALGKDVKVCVIDTGIDKDHPDLSVAGGMNYVFIKGKLDENAWDDDNGHGTHVAGIIAALHNGVGVMGVAPEAKLYAAKVLDKTGRGYVSDIIKAIDDAVANGMQVINMSLSTRTHVAGFEAACNEAYAARVVLVAAAGNEGDGDATTDEVRFPAAYASVIAVAATDSKDDVPWWSCSGPHVELAAPGVAIRSTYKGGTYETMSGTSMAAPHVSGTAALVLAAKPLAAETDGTAGISPEELRTWLGLTADDIGASANVAGQGLVDAEQAATGSETE